MGPKSNTSSTANKNKPATKILYKDTNKTSATAANRKLRILPSRRASSERNSSTDTQEKQDSGLVNDKATKKLCKSPKQNTKHKDVSINKNASNSDESESHDEHCKSSERSENLQKPKLYRSKSKASCDLDKSASHEDNSHSQKVKALNKCVRNTRLHSKGNDTAKDKNISHSDADESESHEDDCHSLKAETSAKSGRSTRLCSKETDTLTNKKASHSDNNENESHTDNCHSPKTKIPNTNKRSTRLKSKENNDMCNKGSLNFDVDESESHENNCHSPIVKSLSKCVRSTRLRSQEKDQKEHKDTPDSDADRNQNQNDSCHTINDEGKKSSKQCSREKDDKRTKFATNSDADEKKDRDGSSPNMRIKGRRSTRKFSQEIDSSDNKDSSNSDIDGNKSTDDISQFMKITDKRYTRQCKQEVDDSDNIAISNSEAEESESLDDSCPSPGLFVTPKPYCRKTKRSFPSRNKNVSNSEAEENESPTEDCSTAKKQACSTNCDEPMDVKNSIEKTAKQQGLSSNVKSETKETSSDSSASEVDVEMVSDGTGSPDDSSKSPTKRGRWNKTINAGKDSKLSKEEKKIMSPALKKLKCSYNQNIVRGKRKSKEPERLQITRARTRKRRPFVGGVYMPGTGHILDSIAYIKSKLLRASLSALRNLHKLLFNRIGVPMQSSQLMRNHILQFSGFSFDEKDEEMEKRKLILEKLELREMGEICDLLGIFRSSKPFMTEKILAFLLKPNVESVVNFVKEQTQQTLQHQVCLKPYMTNIVTPVIVRESPLKLQEQRNDQATLVRLISSTSSSNFDGIENITSPSPDMVSMYATGTATPAEPETLWEKPLYFFEGNGVKLKYIRAVESNLQIVSDSFIQLLHRLLYLKQDESGRMRRNILEFSGLKCLPGTPEYVSRSCTLSVLPTEQLKLICNLLCLPTWHRSRQNLSEGIMDFLNAPRISVMKKRLPPHYSDEITFSFDCAKTPAKEKLPELKSIESEEIEIIPDIHIPDDSSPAHECNDPGLDNEYLGVKLKNFSNIHYQVISTLATELKDIHMILYMTHTTMAHIRNNILEFSGFNFDECSLQYKSRRKYMEYMTIENLKTVASVLCVSQCIAVESKESLIDGILRFLIKPSALLNSSTIMPTITPGPSSRIRVVTPVVVKQATSTSNVPILKSETTENNEMPQIIITEVKSIKEMPSTPANEAISSSSTSTQDSNNTSLSPVIEKIKASFSSQLNQVSPLPQEIIKKEIPDADETSSTGKNTATNMYDSDDDDEIPLSKMIGHPNDDQLKYLIAKIIREAKLQDVTMKSIVRKVYDAYPNYDITYRKEFIKSNVRQILSQMDDPSCSVTTTVIAI